jgi:competence protein ComEC
MSWWIIGFAIGVWLCQQQAELPSSVGLIIGFACATLAIGKLLYHTRRRYGSLLVTLAFLLLGVGYGDWRGGTRLADRLDKRLEGQDVMIVGRIADLPQVLDRSVRFQVDTLEAPRGIPSQLILSWYPQAKGTDAGKLPQLHSGQRWRLLVRLRQPHGNTNPNGFDYEGWIFERGIRASGYVRPKGAKLLQEFDATPMAYVDHWREVIRARFVSTLPDSQWRGVLIALAVGDQASIPKTQWTLFRQTGTTHLMSISGLHVTLVGALFAAMLGGLWRRIPFLALRLPAQKAAVAAGVLAAGLYVLLAGCGVPAQRTFYMLAVAAASLWLERGASASRVMSIALLVVLMLDPWAVLEAGFWLSFGAVAALLLMAQSISNIGGRWQWLFGWVRAQWAVTLFTLPMLLALFQQFSLVSPLANALAIPLVSMVITPLALFFAVLPLPSLAELSNWILGLLMTFLHGCAALPFAMWQQAAPPLWLVVLCCVTALWALLPRGVPGRWVGLLVFVPLLVWSPPRPAWGDAIATVLDVGQGLAVHVRTASHDLLFDTGPRYSQETDAGERIVVPYLRAEGTPRLDMLMVSHNDSDHSGGAESILAQYPVVELRASLPPDSLLWQASVSHKTCLAGQTWDWDGIHFEVLNPPPESVGQGNNGSCVLHVVTKGGSLLLTGDAEVVAENAMLENYARLLHSDIVVAPHHGSASSSQEEFVTATGARYAIFTSGYRNRYHHPAPQVVARYLEEGAQTFRSDSDGAVRFELLGDDIEVSRARKNQARYWFDQSD